MDLTTRTLKLLAIVSQNMADNIFTYSRFVVEHTEHDTYLCWSVAYAANSNQCTAIAHNMIPAFECLAREFNVPFVEMDLTK
jgi:hypothetical protein